MHTNAIALSKTASFLKPPNDDFSKGWAPQSAIRYWPVGRNSSKY
jgi:hypothetical protein